MFLLRIDMKILYSGVMFSDFIIFNKEYCEKSYNIRREWLHWS